MQPMPTTLRARYVLPVESPPLDNGVVHISNGRIVGVEKAVRGASYTDLGDVVLLPGLVNAHTHLEFSNLTRPLGFPGMGFANWIRAVVAHRRSDDLEAPRSAGSQIGQGLNESIRSGVTLCADIVTAATAVDSMEEVGVAGGAFFELLGLADSEIARLLRAGATFLDDFAINEWFAGISPHAPYTISLRCLDAIVRLSADRRIPLAMHLAESQEELELLSSGKGALVDLLAELQAWHPAAVALQTRPLDYLRSLSSAHRTLVIHGNYLVGPDVQLLAANRQRMSVVYCPRTHSYFGHDRYPLRALLTAGVRVALGTDSRASNPDLSVLEEVAHVIDKHRDVSPEVAVRLATLNGARALGQQHLRGSLVAGKIADLVAIEAADSRDPYDALLAEPRRVTRVYRQGTELGSLGPHG